MHIDRFESVDAFVVRDLDGVPAEGVVRCAPKILLDGAQALARSLTYRFASFELRRSGASAGVNAAADARDAALGAFVEAVVPAVAAGDLVLDAAKGVDDGTRVALDAAAGRDPADREARARLVASGVVAAAATRGSPEGRRACLEGLDAMGPALAGALLDELAAAGVQVVGVTLGAVGAASPDGLDVEALRVVGAGGPADALGPTVGAEEVLAAPSDLLLVGSRAGVVGHALARELSTAAVVPWGPIPVTAKALAELGRSGCVVLPDFVTTAGPSVIGDLPPGDPAASGTARDAITAVLDEVAGHEHGPLLGACLRAEAFLSTWRETLPFGRPIA